MKHLIKAQKIFTQIQSIDEEIKVLETDLKNVIEGDLSTELEYTIKKENKENSVLDKDGSIRHETTMSWIRSLSMEMAQVKESETQKLNPSEFVLMFAALLKYKQETRKKLVEDFKKLELKIKL